MANLDSVAAEHDVAGLHPLPDRIRKARFNRVVFDDRGRSPVER